MSTSSHQASSCMRFLNSMSSKYKMLLAAGDLGDEKCERKKPYQGYRESESYQETIKSILDMRDNQHMSFPKIGAKLGLSRSGAHKLYHKHKQ